MSTIVWLPASETTEATFSVSPARGTGSGRPFVLLMSVQASSLKSASCDFIAANTPGKKSWGTKYPRPV
jgi:hypothetical protein